MALNPIAFTERVVEDFLHYQLTTYPLADTDLYAQLRARPAVHGRSTRRGYMRILGVKP